MCRTDAAPSRPGEDGRPDEPAGVEDEEVVGLVKFTPSYRPLLGLWQEAHGMGRGAEQAGGDLGVAVEVPDKEDKEEAAEEEVEDCVPAVEHELKDEDGVELDAREELDSVAVWEVGEVILPEDAPGQVDAEDVERAEDGLCAVGHYVPHHHACDFKGDEGRQVEEADSRLDPELGDAEDGGDGNENVQVDAALDVRDDALEEDLIGVDSMQANL
eukprot:767143-Hanusia_phi.AAC.2